MAFNSGGPSASAEINVTPLIDILLVLLIIFMVLVPVAPQGLSASIPHPPRGTSPVAPEPPLVVHVEQAADGGVQYRLNQRAVAKSALAGELRPRLAGRRDRTLFVEGGRDLEFSSVAEVVAIGHQASAEPIGILTPSVKDGR